MKKWGFIAGIVILICVWQSWLIYHRASSYEGTAAQKAVAEAKKQYHISKIKDVSYYNGKQSYHVIRSVDKSGKDVYIWVPYKKDGKMFKEYVKDGLTKQEALQAFSKLNYDVRKIVSVRLGIDNNQPVWEITFTDHNKEYNYVYLYFKDGKEEGHILHI
ncbi:uncharacterized protein YpmB [Scopulibacillus daqui]|uniref:Uncharacterized protein YpmB n=1 Tax=Scopulibacillus daqui TaxID=1469162 RepID=A0ABS2PYZ7_9BACL|nr:DUF5590 domain-containing protein [Scopulibacillus daqui]MBM7645260.1 uncharacterized protein YpmB [Scopulibacillus daqui]